MKKMKIPFLMLVVTAGLMACQKETQVNSASLDASKTSAIKRGESVLFTFDKANAGSTVNWTVSPATNTQVRTSGNQASILFGVRGNYVVTAAAGGITASRPVTVSDSIYTGDIGGTQPVIVGFSAGEAIQIQLSRLDSGSTSGLIFSAITTNSYACLSNSLVSGATQGSNSFEISYDGVSIPADCTSGNAKATALSFYFPVAEGTNALTIRFNGINYRGSIVKTAGSYRIDWSYNTGILVSPTSL